MKDDDANQLELKCTLSKRMAKRVAWIGVWALIAWGVFKLLDAVTAKPGSYIEERSLALSSVIQSHVWRKIGIENLDKPSKCDDYNTEYDCVTGNLGLERRDLACAALKAGRYLKKTMRECMWIGVNNTKRNTCKDRILIVSNAQLPSLYPEIFETVIKIVRKPCQYIDSGSSAENHRAILRCDDKLAKREKIRINFLDPKLDADRSKGRKGYKLGILSFVVEVQRED